MSDISAMRRCPAPPAAARSKSAAQIFLKVRSTALLIHHWLLQRLSHRGINLLHVEERARHRKGAQVPGQPQLVHAVAVRANMRSILVAMMKSFSCSPLIFLVCRETVALPQPKLIFG
jgi:hypothetical protein